ncbi:MAG: autotransporter domain-containing protein [Rhodomicrobium sp.]|nr:autotransporter domain-containing protein [Rhodomicrobium sp.]
MKQTSASISQIANTTAAIGAGITQDIIAGALDGDVQPETSGLGPLTAGTPGLWASGFMVSGYKWTTHDGFTSKSALGSGKTPEFDEENYGLTIGTRFDGSEFFGAAPRTVTLGVMGNYTHTDDRYRRFAKFPRLSTGSATVDSFSAGGFGLVTDGRQYALFTVVGTYGSPETETRLILPTNAEFDTFGVTTSAMGGVVLSLGESKLDLRGGLTYTHATADDYTDSGGAEFTDAEIQEFSGSVSARLFSVIRATDYTMRPFVQTGVTQRFDYENELKVDGVKFSFDDADTTVFAARVSISMSETRRKPIWRCAAMRARICNPSRRRSASPSSSIDPRL